MGSKRNYPVSVAIERIPLFVKGLDGHIFQLIEDITRFPSIDKDACESNE